jgi:uncharacterized membrane protein
LEEEGGTTSGEPEAPITILDVIWWMIFGLRLKDAGIGNIEHDEATNILRFKSYYIIYFVYFTLQSVEENIWTKEE